MLNIQRKTSINVIIIIVIILFTAAFIFLWFNRGDFSLKVQSVLSNLHKDNSSEYISSEITSKSPVDLHLEYEATLLNSYKSVDTIDFNNLRALKINYGKDFPSKEGLSAQAKNKEIDAIIDYAVNISMNAIVVDINPYYQSKAAGKSLEFNYLKYFIDKARDKDLYVFASLDPLSLNPSYTYTNGYTVKLPDNTLYFNPALPKVREYVAKTVSEITNNYSINALIIDNLSYPSKDFDDDEAYRKYCLSLSVDNFRRKNIDLMLLNIVSAVKEENPGLLVGAEVYGIWGTSPNMKNGISVIADKTSFNDMYADSLTWIKKNWVDFIIPEIQVSTVNKDLSFSNLTQWWAAAVKDTDVGLMISHCAYKMGSSERGWSAVAELSLQFDKCKELTNYRGSIFNGYKDLKSNTTAVTALSLLFKDNLDFTTIFNDLAITSPKNNITTDEEIITVRGICDNNFPLYYNNKELKLSQKGQFAFDVTLKPGKNTIKITHKGRTRTVTVNYKVTVIKEISKAVIKQDGGTQIAIPVKAHKDSIVKGTFNKTSITFQPTGNGDDTDAQQNSEFINYVAVITLPEGKEKEQDLGAIAITATYKGFKETGKTGKIIVNSLPIPEDPTISNPYNENPDGKPYKIAEVTDDYTQTYDLETPGYSTPTNHFLPKGTKDYVLGQMIDMSNDVMLILKSGQKVYKKDCKVFESADVIPANNISEITIDSLGKYTMLTFKDCNNALYKASFNIYKYSPTQNYNTDFNTSILEFTLYNTVTAPDIKDFASPLFTSVTKTQINDTTYKYSFSFNEPNRFYGFKVIYDKDGNMALRFTNPLKLSSDPQKPLSGFNIMIDPGHGGSQPGAVKQLAIENKDGKVTFKNIYEKVINLEVSFKLRDVLKALGANVIMTRETDKLITVNERLDIEWATDPDLILSIHHNSGGSSARGAQSLYYFGFNSKLSSIINEVLNREIYKDTGVNPSASRSYYQELRVLKIHSAMSALIECGFMSNPQELESLVNPETQDKIANAIADGLLDYYK